MTESCQQLVGRARISAAEFARRYAAAFTPQPTVSLWGFRKRLPASWLRAGIEAHFNERVAEFSPGVSAIEPAMKSGRMVRTLAVLVAAGHRSSATALNLSAAGLLAVH